MTRPGFYLSFREVAFTCSGGPSVEEAREEVNLFSISVCYVSQSFAAEMCAFHQVTCNHRIGQQIFGYKLLPLLSLLPLARRSCYWCSLVVSLSIYKQDYYWLRIHETGWKGVTKVCCQCIQSADRLQENVSLDLMYCV